jgi:ABC-type uncharacterized transport system auxiliary subunit
MIGWWWLLGGLVLGACSAVPENHYFTVAYVPMPHQGELPGTATVRVRQLEIAPAYDQERLVYRYSPYEFQYYNFMLWAVKPQRMVTDLLVQHLEQSGIFGRVTYEVGEQRPDYEITGMLNALEELDSGDEWFSHLAIQLHLSRFGEEKPIWSYKIDARKRVYNKNPVYVVKSLSELMEEEAGKMISSLAGFLRARAPGGKKPAQPDPTPGGPPAGQPAPEGDQP